MQQDLAEGVLHDLPALLVLTAAIAVHHIVLPIVVHVLEVPLPEVQVHEVPHSEAPAQGVLVPKALPFLEVRALKVLLLSPLLSQGALVQKVHLLHLEEIERKAPQTVTKGQVLSQAELQR